MGDAEIIKAKMIFLGLIYFQSYGGFSREEILNKFDREFQKLELKPFNESITGYAEIDEPNISLFGQLGHELNSFEFDENIEYYRGTSLHELIHKFLTRRDENGQVIGTGLLKIVDRDSKIYEYLKTSKVNRMMEKLNPVVAKLFHTAIYENEIGRGINEGYTEWFRKNVLKNNENISYEKLTRIFDIIQRRLDAKGGNSIEKMKGFKDGDYDYFFNTLNMSKEVGILFTRALDYMYVREHEREMIQEYLKAKRLQQKLRREEKNEELLNRIERFCANFEEQIGNLKRFKKCKSEQDFLLELNRYVTDSDEKETREFENIETILERADTKQDEKLKITDIKDLQRNIMSSIFGNVVASNAKAFIGNIGKKVKNVFKLRIDKKAESKESGELVSSRAKQKIKKPKISSTDKKRFSTRKNGEGIIDIINQRMQNIAFNMGFFVQDTFDNIKFTAGDIAFEAGNIVDDIKFEVEWHKKELKVMAVIAALAALGISVGFFTKHCIDNNVKDIPAIEEIEKTSDKENELDKIDENEISEEPQEPNKTEDIQKPEVSLIGDYLKDGISLRKGDRVYRTSYQAEGDAAQIAYDYDNLYCDLVRVIKDNKVIQEGSLKDIEELYKIGIQNDANVVLRTGVINEDGTITYVAWCNLNEMIERTKERTEEQENENNEMHFEDFGEEER